MLATLQGSRYILCTNTIFLPRPRTLIALVNSDHVLITGIAPSLKDDPYNGWKVVSTSVSGTESGTQKAVETWKTMKIRKPICTAHASSGKLLRWGSHT
jgi:hypothetical protein